MNFLVQTAEFSLNYTMLTTLAIKANVGKSKMNSAKVTSSGIEPGVTLLRGCSSTSLLILWMGLVSKGLVLHFRVRKE